MTDIAQLRSRAASADLDPESLLNIPMVRHVFSDLSFRLIPRCVDSNWSYERHIPLTMTGFNPFEAAYYYSRDSRMAAWLSDPFGSARNFNDSDLLVKEALFMTHDYLHAWAYSVIDRLFPSLRVWSGAITADTFEDYVFTHLVTEAVATVGLDYWILCQRTVNEFCPIGSCVEALTVAYRDYNLPEYRRACPDLDIQQPGFFRTLATFYCSGEFHGFDVTDIKRSPLLFDWLSHELTYSSTQRKLTRRWLAHLADEPIELTEEQETAPFAIDTPIRQQMIDEVGKLLWDLVKQEGPALKLERPSYPVVRHAPENRPADFRFINLSRVTEVDIERALQRPSDENFKFFLYQFLSQIPLSEFPDRMLKHIPKLQVQCDLALTTDLFRQLPRHEPSADEPRDLLLAN
jgi:hypothetical protein